MKTEKSSLLHEVSHSFKMFMYSEISKCQKALDQLEERTNHNGNTEYASGCDDCVSLSILSAELDILKGVLKKFIEIKEKKLKSQA